MKTHKDWLSQVQEVVIEPDRPIVDPHHHLWRDKKIDAYELDDLWADTASGHNIIGTVFVECSADYRKAGPMALKPVGETEYVSAIARESQQASITGRPPIMGLVSHADLCLGTAVTNVFEAHAAASDGLVRGIRHSAAFHPDPPMVDRHSVRIEHLLMRKDFREGFGCLKDAGLSFDAWLLHTQIVELIDLARAFPDTIIIFDHFGGPLGVGAFAGKQAEIYPKWKQDVAELAKCGNVFAKLGGLAMPLNGWGWHDRALPASSDEIVAAHQDYYLHTIDCFGPARCMFESNFPVDKLSVSYGVLWNAFKKMAARFTKDEQDQLFRATATGVYRLNF